MANTIEAVSFAREEQAYEEDWLIADDTAADLFFVETRKVDWRFGPIRITARMEANAIAYQIWLEVGPAKTKLAEGKLSSEKDQVCVSGKVVVVKVKVCLQAKFREQELWASGEACAKKLFGGWSCRGFKTKILVW